MTDWNKSVERAHVVLDRVLHSGTVFPDYLHLAAAGIVLIVQAIDELREVIPQEPFEVESRSR